MIRDIRPVRLHPGVHKTSFEPPCGAGASCQAVEADVFYREGLRIIPADDILLPGKSHPELAQTPVQVKGGSVVRGPRPGGVVVEGGGVALV